MKLDRILKVVTLAGLLVASLLVMGPAEAHEKSGSRVMRVPGYGAKRVHGKRSNRRTRGSRSTRRVSTSRRFGRSGRDTDRDGYPDHADSDIDADGIRNEDDPAPYRRNIRRNVVIRNPRRDTDRDGYVDNRDSDIDGDGVRNEDDSSPFGRRGGRVTRRRR